MKGYRKLLCVMLACSMRVTMPSSEALAADIAAGCENTGADAAAEVTAETEENVTESDIGVKEQEESETEDTAFEGDGGEKEIEETVSENNGSEDADEGTEGTEAEETQEGATEEDTLPEQAEAVMAATVTEGGETSGSCGENVTWRLEDGVLTISGSGAMEDYEPGYSVDWDHAPWYEYRDNINRLIIEEGVTNIGTSAFYNCSSLTDIELSSGITAIGAHAFEECGSLTGIKLPTGVTSIGENAFYNCQSLTSIEIPLGVTTIAGGTFSYCKSLTGIELPSGVTAIGAHAFSQCASLTSIKLPSGVTAIGGYAFDNCRRLTGIELPSGMTTIEGGTFRYCNGLTGIELPSGITTIGEYAFSGCSGLASIELPSGVTSIGESVFESCHNLTSIKLPSGLMTIGKSAFESCWSLASIKLPSGITTIEGYAFDDCRSLTGIELPSGVTTVGRYAFCDCYSLTSIELPPSVTAIEAGAFCACRSLTGIELPSGVTTIGEYAFDDCRSLTGIELPSGVTTVGMYAFDGCSNLVSIELSSGVTTIGAGAFRSCRSLKNIELPSGVATIEYDTFCGCNSLTSIELSSGVTTIGEGAFHNCSSLTGIELPSGVTTIGSGAFRYCSGLTSVELPFEITTIGESAFDGCNSLTDVYYGGSESDWQVITIGDYNEPLTSATLHCALNDSESDGLKWGLDANGVLIISGTGKMADYREPDFLAPWSGQRDQIKTIIISQGVTSIGSSAFLGCTNLTEITIPKSVVSIGDAAFSGCENLARVRFLGTKEQLESIAVGADNEPFLKASRSWIDSGSNDPDISTSTAVFERKIPFYPWYSGKKEIPMDWGWDLVLKGNSQEYDNSLAKIALALSGASERSQTSVEELLKIKLEVDSDLVLSRNYDLDWYSPGYPGVTFGHKTIWKKNGEKEHVIIAVVRGTTNPVDIRTDLSLGGFSLSAVNITNQLEKYVEACSLNTGEITKDNVKFFVTGHSLGGVVANMVAHGLNGTYGIGNVFAYTFAAPLSTSRNDSYSGNIHNIVNVEDYVPNLSNDFSSCRYGNDWWFYREASPKMYDVFWANFDQSLKACISQHRIMGHHAVETYLSCLLTGDDVAWKQISVGKASICCPVDVKVYNGAGELVGSIIDNRVEEETLSDGVVLYVSGEEKDEKHVLLLTEDTYRLEISAVDDGTMAYTNQYVDMSAEEVLQEKKFQNVTLTGGKQMTSSVSVWDKTDPDISVEDKIDTPQVQLLVLDENDNIVREVLPDGAGTEIPYTGPNEVLPGDIPADGKIPDGLWIAGVAESYIYTGAAIKPEIRVYDGKKKLQPGKDYTASYKNNTKANDAANPSAAPAVVVKGKGNYAGTETAAFQITPVALGDSSVAVEDITAAYNKKVQKKVPVVTYNGRKLTKNRDFTVSYPNGETGAYKEAGTYDILLTAKTGGNFSGTRTVKYTITDNTLLAKVNVKKIPNQTYTRKAIEPELTVTYKNTPLIKGTDYTVSYTDNTEIGTAKAVLTGIGKYAGTKSVTFKITGTSLKGAVLSGIVNQTYNGGYQRLSMTVALHGRTLVEGTDYEVDYIDNKDVGKAGVTIKGKGAYTGTVKKTFQIGKFDIAANRDGRFTVEVKQETIPYAKGGAKPAVAVRFRTGDGRWQTLVEGRDYTLSYRNHTAVNDGSRVDRRPAVTVKGKGNFRGTYGTALGYQIMAQDIGRLTLKAQDKTYRNQKNVFTTKVTVTDLDGKLLKAGTDYNKTAVYTYAEETAVNTASGGTAVRAAGEAVDKNDIIPAGTVLKVQVEAKEGGNYTGMLTGEYRITQAAISSASVSVPKQVYTGQPITLEKSMLTVKVKGKPLDANQYEIVPGSYKNNVKKGTASVTIRGVDNYGGTKAVAFTIRAKGFLWWWR